MAKLTKGGANPFGLQWPFGNMSSRDMAFVELGGVLHTRVDLQKLVRTSTIYQCTSVAFCSDKFEGRLQTMVARFRSTLLATAVL
jgi:hypothetical protein